LTDDTALTIELLKAGFGDCLLVTAPTPAGQYRVLIDTGPHAATYQRLRDRLLQSPPNSDGRRHLDLFIVTHIDHDHIGNAERVLRDVDLALEFGDIWFNGFAQLQPVDLPPGAARGTVEADAVSVAIKELGLPLNGAIGGRAVVAPAPPATSRYRRRPAPLS
jgi:glyoxylase-like metal-dependent hydrolase (beta-lactamase superfamily II)